MTLSKRCVALPRLAGQLGDLRFSHDFEYGLGIHELDVNRADARLSVMGCACRGAVRVRARWAAFQQFPPQGQTSRVDHERDRGK